ncbi:unnamed protein product [Peniophora sp. CBMAI 1063]|nr:unnamed protein product [Peniophora sp. CBMAI 1063]
MIFRDTKENLHLLKVASETARGVGATSENPLRLLDLARSAMSRSEDTQFNAELRFALDEMKKCTTLAGTNQLRKLSANNRNAVLWGAFELCSAYLARDKVLEGHLMIAVDAVSILDNSMGHFHSYGLIYRSRSDELAKCMESVWSNLWASRIILATLDPMRWYLNSLLHNWVHLANTFKCLPAWGTSDIFWLTMFLWTKQPNNAVENPKQMIDCMQILDCVGTNPASDTLEGPERIERTTAMIAQAVKLFGEDAIFSRLKDSMGNTSFSSEDLAFIMFNAHRYAVHPPLSYKIVESGTAHAYLDATRLQQMRGAWDMAQARLCCDFLLQIIVVPGRSQHRTTSLLITEEHMMRDFVLPAMWLGLESRLDLSHGPTSAYEDDVLPEVELVNLVADAARRFRFSEKGSAGRTMMNTLREEVSPYWHLMDRALQGVVTPNISSSQQKLLNLMRS